MAKERFVLKSKEGLQTEKPARLKPRIVFAMTQQEALASSNVVTSTHSLYDFEVHVLFNSRATNSIVSRKFAT